jgi:hypothetical protein
VKLFIGDRIGTYEGRGSSPWVPITEYYLKADGKRDPGHQWVVEDRPVVLEGRETNARTVDVDEMVAETVSWPIPIGDFASVCREAVTPISRACRLGIHMANPIARPEGRRRI